MAVLELSEVTAGYGPIDVLHNISFVVADREIVTILGTNGSGKSTALKTVMGLTRLRQGKIRFKDREITTLPAHNRAAIGMGYVPQTQNVFGELSVVDNLRMGSFLRSKNFESRASKIFDLFPILSDLREKKAAQLSGGERRMLAIGLTLLLEPKILLIDEPSSDLAPAAVEQVYEIISNIYRQLGISILLVEQNVAKAMQIADRVCVLVRGKEAMNAPTAEVDAQKLRQLFLEEKHDE